MPIPDDQLAALERVLDGASLWGAELETQFRVLATTFEPTAARHPEPGAADRRLQVLFHPVHTILGVLRSRTADGQLAIQRFEVDLLVDVVDSFHGDTLRAPLFDQGEPAPGEWGPADAGWSVEGRATTLDGKAHDLRVCLRDEHEGRALDLYATFDEVRVLTASGREWDLRDLVGGT